MAGLLCKTVYNPKNMQTENILSTLAKTPSLLEELLSDIPTELYKVQRIPDKWTIHEHACHICEVDDLMMNRLDIFLTEDQPQIKPYFPDKEKPLMALIDQNLPEKLDYFSHSRQKLMELFNHLPAELWTKEASHPEYNLYTPYIMLRHLMMHDHLHLYRIEELGFTKEEFLRK
jgi:uncharacterized damage-inducible protein DinB